jgi:basic membrane protein A and related proteins
VRKTARMALVAALAALALTACGDRDSGDDNNAGDETTSAAPTESTSAAAPSSSAPANPDFKACEVSDSGGFDDKGFNQTALKGQTDAAEQFGIQTAQVESTGDEQYADNINQMVQQGCNEITTVGFLLGDATLAAAKKNPDIDFAIVDYAYDKAPANLKGLTYSTDQPSYLAGYLAAGLTKSGIIGTFGGLPIPTVTIFMEGFRQGVEKYNEDNGTKVKLLGWDGKDGSFTEDFEDKTKGQSVGEQLIGQGADILFPVAGPAGLGGLQAAKDAGAHAIWRHPLHLGDEGHGRLGDRGDQGVDRRQLLQRALLGHAGQRRCEAGPVPRLRRRHPAGAEGQDRRAQAGHHRRLDHDRAGCQLTPRG